MARKATGTITEHTGKDGRTYRGLRFTAYGKRRFVSLGPITGAEAERELRHVLADVERGTWEPQTAPDPPPEREPAPTFHQYAEEWWTEREHEWAPNTQADYRARLEQHLLPFFGEHLLTDITPRLVDRYMAHKLTAWRADTERRDALRAAGKRPGPKGAIGPTYINATLKTLGAVLARAMRHGEIPSNPAAGKDARVKSRRPTRTYLDRAEQIDALLTAAGELDAKYARDDRCRHIERRAMLAVALLAGPRISELLHLRWRDVQLAEKRLRIGGTKTDAAARDVTLRPALLHELASLRNRTRDARPGALVFPTRTGKVQSKDTFRERIIDPARERANVALTDAGYAELPRLTAHSLRRTFASLMLATGESPPLVMAEMGHTDAAFTMTVYAQAMRGDDEHREALRAIVNGPQLADIGIRAENVADLAERRHAA